jgi:hypothetical protein
MKEDERACSNLFAFICAHLRHLRINHFRVFACFALSRSQSIASAEPAGYPFSNGRTPHTIRPRWFSFFASTARFSASARFAVVVALMTT